nr:prepilin-type N-terminal cleavage/methylation domain-containing protein [Rhodoferax sp.]
MYPNSPNRHRPRTYSVRGFTLIELIMVILLMGILAVYAAPRVFDSNTFYSRGFHDETLGYLRYAQKTAIAQRRTVCVAFASGSLTLSIASLPAVVNCAAPGSLTGPKGNVASATLNARAGVAYSIAPSAPTSFNYNGLGQPTDGAGAAVVTQTFQVVGVDKSIRIESATGYVHEQ